LKSLHKLEVKKVKLTDKPVKLLVSPSVAVSVHEDVLPDAMSEGKYGLIFDGAESPVFVTLKTDKYVSRSSNSTWNPIASCSPCLSNIYQRWKCFSSDQKREIVNGQLCKLN
jgi:hypothetical protein